ncbi:hypothetical protein [Curtobacterium sp. NPDC092190]|uniref:hypothetical protein n=1 Tax=Curtobacterium sp. NPDC092190 TaxID=3363973 RepID=UPI00381F6E1B
MAALRSKEQELVEPQRKLRAQVARNRVVGVLMLLVFIILPIVTFVFGPSIMSRYDQRHMITITCDVAAAKGEIMSSRSTKGAGGSQAQVSFDTRCGNLLYQDGVTRQNMRSIAASVSPGTPYRFHVGEGSFKLRAVLSFLKVAPVVQDYSKAD